MVVHLPIDPDRVEWMCVLQIVIEAADVRPHQFRET